MKKVILGALLLLSTICFAQIKTLVISLPNGYGLSTDFKFEITNETLDALKLTDCYKQYELKSHCDVEEWLKTLVTIANDELKNNFKNPTSYSIIPGSTGTFLLYDWDETIDNKGPKDGLVIRLYTQAQNGYGNNIPGTNGYIFNLINCEKRILF
jgi:hypothetical protein